jgi:hypothetical protein
MRIPQSSAPTRYPDHFLAIFEYFNFLFSGFLVSCDCTQWDLDYYVFSSASATVISTSYFAIFSMHIFEIPEVQEGPEVAVSAKDNMRTTPAIAAIRSTHCCELVPHKMPATGASMSTSAKNPDLINEITLLQYANFTICDA